jgi:hypothetical protein
MASLFSHLLNKLFILFATKEIAMTFKRFTAALVLLASAGLTHAADAGSGTKPGQRRQVHHHDRRHGQVGGLQQSLRHVLQAGPPAARSALGANGLALGGEVEVECMAYAPATSKDNTA